MQLSDSRNQEEFRSRIFTFAAFVLIFFLLLVGRIWYLQIFSGRKFREFSEKNRITIKKIIAMRGRVLDRNGVVIADTRPSFDITLTPYRLNEPLHVAVDRISKLLSWTQVDLEGIKAKAATQSPYDPIVLKRDMSWDEMAKFLARKYAFPGVEVIYSPARSYPFGNHGSHILGYLSEIGKADMARLKDKGDLPYGLGDIWGISGIEKTFEASLKGINGARPFIEDAWGREIREEFSQDLLPAFAPRPQVPGEDLVLAIDHRVQEAAEQAFKGEAGAVVAMNPQNGDILALVSRPEYLPENFVRGVSSQYWRELLKDPLNPLYDRALRGLYPPGSTFKMVTGLVALSRGVTNPKEVIHCPGFYRLGRETKRCWKKEGHGNVDFHKAMAQSCDVYFYEMGRRVGVDGIAEAAKALGMGTATGIGINREENGLVPTEAWKAKVYRQPWVGGETLSVAIGQGFLQVTPIQLAVSLSTLLNNGSVLQPRIALRSQTPEGAVVQLFPEVVRSKVTLDSAARMEVIKGLDAVVNEPGGTAYWASRSTLVRIGGKTGTAQTVGRHSGSKLEDHAWFMAFAPVENPTIVVTVIVEHGGHGSSSAAPIAKKVIEAYVGETS